MEFTQPDTMRSSRFSTEPASARWNSSLACLISTANLLANSRRYPMSSFPNRFTRSQFERNWTRGPPSPITTTPILIRSSAIGSGTYCTTEYCEAIGFMSGKGSGEQLRPATIKVFGHRHALLHVNLPFVKGHCNSAGDSFDVV